MKYILLPILFVATLALSSCGQSEIVNDAQDSAMRKVASTTVMDVYIVEIDEEEYVIAQCIYGISITPKTKPPTK